MGEYKTQSRVTNKPYEKWESVNNGPFTLAGATQSSWTDTSQTTESYRSTARHVEWGPDEVKAFLDTTRNGFTERDNSYDNGHPFYTTKTSIRLSHPQWNSYAINPSDGKLYRYKLPLFPFNNNASALRQLGVFPTAPRLSASEVSKFGAIAVSESSPTNTHANLATFLGELTEGLPRLIGATALRDRTQVAHAAGGEYLNYVFGWKPLVSDVRAFASAAANSAKILKQYKRDSGKLVRRSYSFPTLKSTTNPVDVRSTARGSVWGLAQFSHPWFYEPGYDGLPPVYHVNHKVEKMWFKGAFTYYLESDDSIIGKLERFEQLGNHLLGTRLTPSVLWELAPWSWLADWEGTIGDFFNSSSLLSADGLVMKYGYLMRHTKEYNSYTMPDGLVFKGKLRTGPIRSVWERETKERVKATPYGFGLNVSSFSARQWAILGALGLTRAPRALR